MVIWLISVAIACPIMIRLTDLLATRFLWLKTALWLLGYCCLLGGSIDAAISRSFDVGFFLYAPDRFFSLSSAITLAIGVVLLAASGPTYQEGDDFPDDDFPDEPNDPWGPDFDQARAQWERPLVKS